MKPKIQAGTTQKAKEGNNMSFLRPIPTPIFDTNMLTIPWTPTREASLNHSPLGKYGCFQSIFPGFLNYQLRSHAFCHQLVFLPNRFCFSPLGRSLGPAPVQSLCTNARSKLHDRPLWQQRWISRLTIAFPRKTKSWRKTMPSCAAIITTTTIIISQTKGNADLVFLKVPSDPSV